MREQVGNGSRGRIYANEGAVRRPPPLTENQKNIIEAWARRGRRDREIADHLGITEYRVQAYRSKLSIASTATGGYHQDDTSRSLRPAHVRGTSGDIEDPQWRNSCNEAFAAAVKAAGGW